MTIQLVKNLYGKVLLESGKISTSRYTPSVTDYDGNVYTPIVIGSQTWLKENMKAEKSRNGTSIAFTYPGNNSANKADYGLLYKGQTTVYNTISGGDNANFLPVGYRAATVADWDALITFAGGSATGGGKLKETGTTHWKTPNTDATNVSGFTALPAGIMFADNVTFIQLTEYGQFWSSSGGSNPICYYIGFDSGAITKSTGAGGMGRSVRAIKE